MVDQPYNLTGQIEHQPMVFLWFSNGFPHGFPMVFLMVFLMIFLSNQHLSARRWPRRARWSCSPWASPRWLPWTSWRPSCWRTARRLVQRTAKTTGAVRCWGRKPWEEPWESGENLDLELILELKMVGPSKNNGV